MQWWLEKPNCSAFGSCAPGSPDQLFPFQTPEVDWNRFFAVEGTAGSTMGLECATQSHHYKKKTTAILPPSSAKKYRSKSAKCPNVFHDESTDPSTHSYTLVMRVTHSH